MIGDGKWEIGEPLFEEPTDPDITYHVHDDGNLAWPFGTSIRCTYCWQPKPDHTQGKTINWTGLERLRNHREAGTTSLGMEREIIETARAEGRLDKIDRAR